MGSLYFQVTLSVCRKSLMEEQNVVAMHPGWCYTDMGGPKATSTALEGAIRIYNCMWIK